MRASDHDEGERSTVASPRLILGSAHLETMNWFNGKQIYNVKY